MTRRVPGFGGLFSIARNNPRDVTSQKYLESLRTLLKPNVVKNAVAVYQIEFTFPKCLFNRLEAHTGLVEARASLCEHFFRNINSNDPHR